METKFLDLNDLFELRNQLLTTDIKSIDYIIEELSRLQMVIKDYELGIRLINDKFQSKTGKEPINRNL